MLARARINGLEFSNKYSGKPGKVREFFFPKPVATLKHDRTDRTNNQQAVSA